MKRLNRQDPFLRKSFLKVSRRKTVKHFLAVKLWTNSKWVRRSRIKTCIARKRNNQMKSHSNTLYTCGKWTYHFATFSHKLVFLMFSICFPVNNFLLLSRAHFFPPINHQSLKEFRFKLTFNDIIGVTWQRFPTRDRNEASGIILGAL